MLEKIFSGGRFMKTDNITAVRLFNPNGLLLLISFLILY